MKREWNQGRTEELGSRKKVERWEVGCPVFMQQMKEIVHGTFTSGWNCNVNIGMGALRLKSELILEGYMRCSETWNFVTNSAIPVKRNES
jgi:hypothetical protein